MRVEVAGLGLVVVAERRFVGEARGVAEQHAQRDLALGVSLEGAVDREAGQVRRDRHVEVEPSGLDGPHHGRGGEGLRHRLDTEDRVDGDRRTPVAFVEPKPCCHTTRSPSTTARARPGMCSWAISSGILASVARDDRGDAVVLGRHGPGCADRGPGTDDGRCKARRDRQCDDPASASRRVDDPHLILLPGVSPRGP